MRDRKVRFGPFELDTDAGELMRGRQRLRLQDKPLKLLLALLEQPHEVVSREALRARLWAPTTVVEFDDGLNTAVNKLRKALGDSAAAPKFIETVGRRGYRFIGEFAEDDTSTEADEAANSTPRRPRKRRLRASWVFSAAAAAALSAAVLYTIITSRSDPSPVTRFTVVVPSAQTIEAGAYQSVAISPAATYLAYVANGRIYLRARDAAEAQPVPGTEDQGPLLGVLFSPDSKWIGFYSSRHRELRKVPLSGGIPVRISSAEGYLGGNWAADGRIIFAKADGIYAAPDGGGEPELLVPVHREDGERAQNPTLLPGGRTVLFTFVTNNGARRHIAVQPLQAGGRSILMANGTDARYVETGHLVFADAGTLMVAPFDVRALQMTGTPFPVAQGLQTQSVIGSADFVISRNGTLVYRAVARPLRTLVWVERDGAQEPVDAPSLPYHYAARVSPDGAKIAVTVNDEEGELFVWNIASRTFTRLTFNSGMDSSPVWTPDSGRIIFASDTSIVSKSADGAGAIDELLDNGTELAMPSSLAPSAAQLVYRHPTFVSSSGTQDNDVWILSLDDGRATKPLLATEHQELNAEISPDGRWIAYQWNGTGRFEIYIRPFPHVDGGRWQVSTGGGFQPLWSPSGSELFYLSSGRLMSTAIGGAETPVIGAPRAVLDRLPYAPYERSGRSYDVAPDGQRFLFVRRAPTISDNPSEGANRYEVVLNWTEELKRLVSAR